MDLKNQLPSYTPKNITFDSESDSQSDLRIKVQTFLEVEYFQGYFPNLPHSDQSLILQQFPSTMYYFLQRSFLLHKTQLSIVLLCRTHDIFNIGPQENTQKYQANQQHQYLTVPFKNLCIIKQNFSPNINSTIQQQKSNHQYLKQINIWKSPFKTIDLSLETGYNGSKSLMDKQDIQVQPFLGFSLSSLMVYFGSDYKISLLDVLNLFRQLISQVKSLHQRHIVHGDISPSNILLSTNKNLSSLQTNQLKLNTFYKQPESKNLTLNKVCQICKITCQNKEQSIEKQTALTIKDQLQSQLSALVSELYDHQNHYDIQQKIPNQRLKISLIDFGNSWVQDQSFQLQMQQASPTQTINYRSPEALHKRGSFEVDIWGLGHILFCLFTGTNIFPLETQFSQSQLRQILSDEHQFHLHIQSLISLNRQPLKQQQQTSLKIIKTIKNCLMINKIQRPSIQELAHEWC